MINDMSVDADAIGGGRVNGCSRCDGCGRCGKCGKCGR